jgi:hypothetical protein
MLATVTWVRPKAVPMLKHVFGCFFGFVVLGGAIIHADSRDELARAKSDFESLRSHHESSRSRLGGYLEASVKLRSFDQDQVNELVTQICRLDIEDADDEAARIAKDLRDRAVERVRSEYDKTVDTGSKVFDDLGRIESEAKSQHSRVKDLEGKDEVKDDARRLREEIEKVMEGNTRNFEKIHADRSTLDRVKDGVMNGSNNPLIRARMDYGKEMHERLQRDRGCHEKEVSLSSGRPDCIRFDPGDCKVIEFKPDTYSTDTARRQADGYVADVRDRFKNDERAKQCKQNSDGPVFEAVGETYPACRP